MVVELINTGTELMLGRVLNTHQQWLCRRLTDLGYLVARQVAVPDTAADIQQAVREALSRADLIITTGGLGPTSDDITRELIAELLGKPLREDSAIVDEIKKFFAGRNRPMPERNRVQALVPEGALVLPNPNGTAPGLAMELGKMQNAECRMKNAECAKPEKFLHSSFRLLHSPQWLVMLPGPPRELQPMFNDAIVPLLQRVLPPPGKFVCRTFRTSGLGESFVQERIAKPLVPLIQSGLELGYCAHIGQVDVRLAARGDAAERIVSEAADIVRARLGTAIFGDTDEEIETLVIRLLTERKQTLAVAESCTGGGIADRLTNVPGASAVFLGGFVTYSNEMKEKFLGVRRETLAQHGAVSDAVAREMAEGARRATGSDFAIAVTGIAGPGQSPESGGQRSEVGSRKSDLLPPTSDLPLHPVGTVFIALAHSRETKVWKRFNPWDRLAFKEATARQAINELRLALESTVSQHGSSAFSAGDT